MTTKTGIIYLQRDKFQVYSPYLPNILEFRFVPELIRDFDIVNRQLFENLLKVFIGNNKVPPSNMVIIVSDSASFIKDFVSPPQPVAPNPQQQTPPPTLEDLQNAAITYLEHVPFEMVSSKVFPLATGVRAYATNQEMYETIKLLLEKQGFIIQSVFPGFVFGPNLSNRTTLDGPIVSEMLQKISALQGYNLLKDAPQVQVASVTEETEEKESTTNEEEEKPEKPEKENKNVMIAVAVSAIVLIVAITGVVIYLQFQDRPYTPPSRPTQQAPAPTAPPQVTQSVSTAEAGELTVQITSSSSTASTAATLRSTLTNFGFQSIVPQTQTTLGSSSNLLFFSSRVSQDIRTSVTQSVKEIVPDIVVQERPDASFDVTVILGQQ